MGPTVKMLCDNCGQQFAIERTNNFNYEPLKYCPTCGAGALRVVRTSFESLSAACFAGVAPQLVQLLLEVWALNKNDERTTDPSFVQYMNAQLTISEMEDDVAALSQGGEA